MIKNKKGFLAVSIIYSFFIVFLLIMLSMLADYLNKKYLKDRIDMPSDKLVYCTDDDTFAHCLIKNEYKQYYEHQGETDYENYAFLGNGTSVVENGAVDYEKMITKLTRKSNTTTCSNKAEGIYKTKDDQGNSYYYRGDVKNNYVEFAGFLWRIVRINGDGSIRLILTGFLDSTPVDTQNKLKGLAIIPDGKTQGSWKNKIDCIFNYDHTISTRRSGSLLTNFNNPGGNFVCNENNAKYDVGIKYNNPSNFSGSVTNYLKKMGGSLFDIKDSVYANDENSDILMVLYAFYDYLKAYEGKIDKDSIFCADKNIMKDDNKTITKILCDSYQWGPNRNICESPWFDLLSTAKTNINYYNGISRILASDIADLKCSESCKTASNTCHKAINLSTYSLKSHGKVKYAFNSSFSSNKAFLLDAGKCGEYKDKGYCEGNSLALNETACETGWFTGTWHPNVVFESFWYNRLEDAINNDRATYNDPNVIGNGALDYPIGLISADEALLAGSTINIDYKDKNGNSIIKQSCSGASSSISSDTFKNYWTSTAAFGDYNNVNIENKYHAGIDELLYDGDTSSSSSYYFVVNFENIISMSYASYLNNTKGLYARPVININGNLTGIKGSGTFDDPYVIN